MPSLPWFPRPTPSTAEPHARPYDVEAQLLFASVHDDAVTLDLVGHDVVHPALKSLAGVPFTLEVRLPAQGEWRDTFAVLLEEWASAMRIIGLHFGHSRSAQVVRLTSRATTLSLDLVRLDRE